MRGFRRAAMSMADRFDAPPTEYVAISLDMLRGVPVRVRRGFAFVRPWRELSRTTPVADLGGVVVFRRADIPGAAGPEPWVVQVYDWEHALTEPTMLMPRQLKDRGKRE